VAQGEASVESLTWSTQGWKRSNTTTHQYGQKTLRSHHAVVKAAVVEPATSAPVVKTVVPVTSPAVTMAVVAAPVAAAVPAEDSSAG
jgi:hypothetical protein